MSVRIQIRRDSSANWVANNPSLREGEIGIELDTLKIKIGPEPVSGDSTPWNSITNYANLVPSDFDSIINGYVEVNDIGAAGGVVGLNSSKNAIVPGSSIIIEGPTNDSYETTLTVTDPTADRTLTLPDVTGTIATEGYVDDAISAFDALPSQSGNNGKYLQTNGSSTQWATLDLSTKQDKVTGVSDTEIGYLDGVTSAIQTQLDDKQPKVSGVSDTEIGYLDGVTSSIQTQFGNKQDKVSGVSDTEIGYLDGVTSAIQTQLNDKSPIASPTFTGVPAAPTATAGTNTTQIATTAFVKKAVEDLIDGAPGALDTLNELAAAINDDASYAATISTALGNKQDKVTGVSDTEIGYLDGVTSAIQTQLDGKSATGHGHTASNISDFTEAAQDAVGNAVGNGLKYTDSTGEIEPDLGISGGLYIDPSNKLSVDGYYVTFNSAEQTLTNKTINSPKINENVALTATATELNTLDGITASTSELNILDGVTASASEINILDGATLSTTELNYVDGVTSAIQTQIDDKLSKTGGTMTGFLTLSGAPESALHAATKAYVDNISAGLNFHQAVHASTSTNITTDYNNGTNGLGATLTAMSNGAIGTVDGHQVVLNDRILVKAQTDAKQNGIYYVSNAGGSSSKWVLTRALDADNSPTGEIATGDFCFVQNGALSGGYGYLVSTTGTITIGTTDINYVQFNAGQSVTAGNGLTEPSAGELAIDTAVTVDLNTAQTLTNKTITGTFTGNVTGSVSGNAGTVTNGVYTTDTGTVTSTMIANGTIVNADINDSAAIALSKLATDPLARANHTGTQAASTISDFNEAAQDAVGNALGSGLSYTDSTGAISVDTTTIQARVSGVSDTEIGYLDGVTSAIQTQLDAKLASSTAASTYLPLTGGTLSSDLTVTGNLTVNGTTTNINTTNLVIEDKNIILGDVATPSNITANGGGITLNGDTNKTFNWVNSTSAWTSSEHIDLASGKVLKIAGTEVLSATAYTGKAATAGNADTATDGVVTTGTYSNPSWITGLAWSKISSTPTSLSGYGITDALSSSTAASTYQTIVTGVSDTEIGYLDGVTSAIQTQLDGKLSLTNNTEATVYGSVVFHSVSSELKLPDKVRDSLGNYSSSGKVLGRGQFGAAWVTPSQAGIYPSLDAGKYLTNDGTSVSWATISSYSAPTIGSTSISSGSTVTSISGLTLRDTSSTSITGNTATTVDTNALSGFTTAKYVVSIKQGTKIRSSEVIVQTDGTSVDLTEFGITETGGTISGIVVAASVSSTNQILTVTITDASSTNATVKINKILI